MKRVLVGTIILGLVLTFFPGERSSLAYMIAAFLSTLLLLQLGPRSIVEKVGVLMIVSAIAWIAGPRAARGESLILHLCGWFVGGTALSFYLHPRSE
ncbi:MAG: hypothetical protein A2506_01030 [Elusimicrobia bacterium RIFOXYD12_FULL_66_9]|nr:MAG: hypothetical protein A2506_01030 [Elusimicrobia bacterium RIFOXYD12_FULL_66_9]